MAVMVLSLAVASLAAERAAAADHSATNPFAAHNAYPYRLLPDKQKFSRALDAGLKYVEVDVTYDPNRKAIVATHDSTAHGNEPELGELIAPLWERWAKTPPEDHYTLVIDFKSVSPEIVEAFKQVIEPHAELLSRLPKSEGGTFEPRHITVCLTGDTAAHRLYADSIPADGEYLAFGDHGSGAWKANIADYVPSAPAGFVRFLTYEKQTFMDAADAKGNEHISAERMKEAVRLANERGYRIRVYTVNPPRRGGVLDDAYWSACVDSGVHMIATDAYEIARDWWNERAEKTTPAAQP
ncbi:MAG: hypothetical protein KF708_15485 [Pirellulales bacterium]|nr:hypothetical protein [Pirellulales bacterium]